MVELAHTSDVQNIDLLTMISKIKTLNNNQLNILLESIKDQKNLIANESIHSLKIGDNASFKHKNRKVIGSIIKINRKTVVIFEELTKTNWKINANCII